MKCVCGRALSLAWALDGAVYRYAGSLYCSEGCARFHAEAFGAVPEEPAEVRR